MSVDGRHVVVTGGGTGVGRAIAETMAHAGAGLTRTDCRNPACRSWMSEIAEKIEAKRTIIVAMPGMRYAA